MVSHWDRKPTGLPSFLEMENHGGMIFKIDRMLVESDSSGKLRISFIEYSY
jgi:hypothetical protein